MNNKITTSTDTWAYVLFCSAVGLTYGTFTTLPALLDGCYGADSQAFCGVLSALVNIPSMMLGAVFFQSLQYSLHRGLWGYLAILLGNTIFFGFFGIVLASTKQEKYMRYGFLMPIFAQMIFPLFLFFFPR